MILISLNAFVGSNCNYYIIMQEMRTVTFVMAILGLLSAVYLDGRVKEEPFTVN